MLRVHNIEALENASSDPFVLMKAMDDRETLDDLAAENNLQGLKDFGEKINLEREGIISQLSDSFSKNDFEIKLFG